MPKTYWVSTYPSIRDAGAVGANSVVRDIRFIH